MPSHVSHHTYLARRGSPCQSCTASPCARRASCTPCRRSSSISAPVRSRSGHLLGQSLRAIFARALKRAMRRPRRAPRHRRRRRDDASNDDTLFLSRDRSRTFTISHTPARRREGSRDAIAPALDLDPDLDRVEKRPTGQQP